MGVARRMAARVAASGAMAGGVAVSNALTGGLASWSAGGVAGSRTSDIPVLSAVEGMATSDASAGCVASRAARAGGVCRMLALGAIDGAVSASCLTVLAGGRVMLEIFVDSMWRGAGQASDLLAAGVRSRTSPDCGKWLALLAAGSWPLVLATDGV